MVNRQDQINHICLLILTGIALTSALIFTKPVAVPFTISIFVYLVLTPTLQWLQRTLKLSRIIALSLTMFLFLSLSTLVVFFLVDSLQAFTQSAKIYQSRIYEFVDTFLELGQRFGLPVNLESIRTYVYDLPIFSLVKQVTESVFALLGNFFLIVIFVAFMLLGEAQGSRTIPLINQIQSSVSKYVSAKIFVSLATAVSAAIILSALKVELVLMFSLLTFLLNFIPNIGSIIAVALPLPIAFLQYGFSWKFYLLVALSLIVQNLWGTVIEPKLMGESLDLHPVSVLASLLFWGLVWGIPGMFLAVPITATIKIVLYRIDTTKPIAELLAGRF